MTVDESSQLGGTLIGSSSTGSFSFRNIYFKSSGTRIITVSAKKTGSTDTSKTATLTVIVSDLQIKIISFNPVIFIQLSNIGVKSSITVNMVDSQNNIQTSNEAIPCTLDLKNFDGSSLQNSNLEIDNAIVKSSNGICTFLNVRIKRSGEYTIYVSSISSGVKSDLTSKFTTESSIVAVKISSAGSLDKYTAYFVYDFNIELIGESNFAYLEDANLKLSANENGYLGGTLTGSTNTGALTFTSIYFKSSGDITITAEATDSDNKKTNKNLIANVEKSQIEISQFNAVRFI